jgi:hypothetical protein
VKFPGQAFSIVRIDPRPGMIAIACPDRSATWHDRHRLSGSIRDLA